MSGIYTKEAIVVATSPRLETDTEFLKNESIKFLPIVDNVGKLNIITKNQMYALLLQDIHADLTFDFFSLDTSIVDHEIFHRHRDILRQLCLMIIFKIKL